LRWFELTTIGGKQMAQEKRPVTQHWQERKIHETDKELRTAIGIALVIPACASWSLGFAEQALKKGKEGVSSAAETLGDIAGKAQHHFGEAAKTAKTQTAKAAGVVESAARSVREYAS
jgi:hypothetical protein